MTLTDKSLITLIVIFIASTFLLVFPEGLVSTGLVFSLSFLIVFTIHKYKSEESRFLIKVFLGALLFRLAFGLFIHVFDLRGFFGGDALAYDLSGGQLADIWSGKVVTGNAFTQSALQMSGSGWGMNYLTGIIYFTLGKNIYTAQSFCAVIGAATAPLAYICAYDIFNNRKVGKVSALLVAFFPAFIIWSGQLLKDGVIVFLLVVIMIMVLRLQEKLSYSSVAILILAMFGIISLRFYIFYMVILAVVGAFIIGQSSSPKAIIQRLAVLIILGLGLTYLGVLRNASKELDRYGSLEAVQRSRSDLAKSAGSGFGEDVDVSTTEGALSTIPIGFVYLMFAPFPWQMGSLRSGFTLPEILVWWSMMPLLATGILYAVKTRLRKALPVLIFTLMLTLAYSVFQGNVGTAYRQRTQIQVFLFMFIAVGWVMRQEKKENKIYLKNAREQKFRERLKIGNSINLKRT